MFKLTKNFRTFVIQHVQTGDYLYSENTIAEAWEAEKGEAWAKDHPGGLEAAKNEFLATVTEYSSSEVLEAAKCGYTWPKSLGLVEELDDDK